jgi:hypothetical protein
MEEIEKLISRAGSASTLVKRRIDPAPGMAAADVAKGHVAAAEGAYRGKVLDPGTLGG